MIKMKSFLLLLAVYHLFATTASAPPREDTRDLPTEPEAEDRRLHNRRRRPCGKSAEGDGRTFLIKEYAYINVNYNYLCGGGGGGHRPLGGLGGGHRPILGGHHHGGGLFGGLHGGGGGLHGDGGGGGIHGGGGGIHGDGGGIQGGGGGIHGGGGGLFGGNGGGWSQSIASSGSQGGGGGPFGLGLFNWLMSIRPIRPSRPSVSAPAQPPVKPPEPDKPNYEVDKPVHEEYDDIVPEGYQNWKPGQYLAASHPFLGTYVKDITNFNPNKIIRQVNREFNSFFKPLYHLLRR